MPRLPVTGRLATLAIPAVLALMALAAGPAMAQQPANPPQPTVETLMYHMTTNDRDVNRARKNYASAVDAAMLYSLCAADYRVDEAKKDRFNDELAKEDRTLRAAFVAAHQKLTNKLPSDATNAAIDTYIKDFQTKQATDLGTQIRATPDGCTKSAMKRIDKFYEDKYAYELQLKAAAEAEEEKRRQQAPAVATETETQQ